VLIIRTNDQRARASAFPSGHVFYGKFNLAALRPKNA
jgi:hypothetical protein